LVPGSNDTGIKRRLMKGERVALSEKRIPFLTEEIVTDDYRAE
jgi:hypothetical protein